VTEARAAISAGEPDLVLLDINMPGGDGLTLAAELRARTQLPIIILSGKGSMVDKVVGLEVGADDYVAKPFEPRELSLRIANILRHTRPGPAPALETIRFGDFVFHLGRGELRRGDEVVHLTDREREMLRVLTATPGETVPRLALAGTSGLVSERAVDVQVTRLRRKIEPDPKTPRYLQTLRGVGYMLAPD
jgi:two-component system phosphate regulon response regulator OmpR